MIKKYNNRRLYDTEKNAYVTLAALAEMIKEGRQIEVVDAQTKEDVTAFTLTQIILEEAKKKNFLLPVPLLHLMIQFGETVLSEFFEKYLQQVVKNYLAYKSSVDTQFSKWLDLGAVVPAGPAGDAPLQSLHERVRHVPQDCGGEAERQEKRRKSEGQGGGLSQAIPAFEDNP